MHSLQIDLRHSFRSRGVGCYYPRNLLESHTRRCSAHQSKRASSFRWCKLLGSLSRGNDAVACGATPSIVPECSSLSWRLVPAYYIVCMTSKLLTPIGYLLVPVLRFVHNKSSGAMLLMKAPMHPCRYQKPWHKQLIRHSRSCSLEPFNSERPLLLLIIVPWLVRAHNLDAVRFLR